jgi:hypothetical protein
VGFEDSDPEPVDRLIQMLDKDAVPIVNQVFVLCVVSDRPTQLLQRPSA